MKHFCGCCGREISKIQVWCNDCSKHVGNGERLWEQTYEAMYDRPCPFSVQRKP